MSNSPRTAFGLGVATQTNSGQILECYFHNLGLGSAPSSNSDDDLSLLLGDDSIRKVKKIAVKTQINLDDKPKDVWTSAGACAVDGFEKVRHELQNKYGNMIVYGVDKFPRMVDYVIPEGVRIADGDRVRLGAYLSAGTTVMHEGFINFNAGTLGKSMVEGRISAGVVVGDGSDIGGGASIMGTLSGGGKEVISVGQRTLLGANSGIGISLGDDCIVEAGIYITAGSKITLPDGKIVKAKDLSGANNLLFRRNSQSGSLEVLPKTGTWSGLNSVLHNN